MSDLAVPAPHTQPQETKPNQKQTDRVPVSTVIWFVISLIPSIIFAAGAAKLSYDRFQSIGWAIIAFIFSPIYYMYYALFVSTPVTPTMIAAARRAWRM
jgi:hypothetical protein